jgi:predicted metalloendopeptidase
MRSLRLICRTIAVAITFTTALPLQLPAQAAAPARSSGIDIAGMDRSARPGDDFFAYANGTWLEKTEIPADRSSYGAGSMLAEQTDRRVADLIQQTARTDGPAGSEQRKIGDFYTSFMDTTAIEAAGLKPLKSTLDSISAIRDRKALARFLGSTLRADVDALNATNFYTENLLGLWVAQDLDDPTQYSPFLLQGGLGMPDRSYYTDTSAAMAGIRNKYQEHVGALLELAGIPDGTARAEAITRLETKIAEAHWTREESGQVSKGNNHWSRAEFARKAPGLDWEGYFAGAGLTKPERFVVWQPSAVTGISALAASEPLRT